MKFRPYRSPASPAPTSSRRSATSEIVLARRSAYLMTQSRGLHMNITSRQSSIALLGDVPHAPMMAVG